jgi:Ca2+-binding RTX toxin-like protein
VIALAAGDTRLGPGNDSWRGNNVGAPVRIDGGSGNDSFIGEYGCQCAFFAGLGNDTFDLVSRLTLPAKYRGQLVDGGPGSDGGAVDGYDCTRPLEHVTVTKKTSSDRRFRCHTPAAKLR